jgi:class 3 adenylate cyclase
MRAGSFDTILARELLKAERMKATVVATLVGLVMLIGTVVFLFAGDTFAEMTDRPLLRFTMMGALLPLFGWELFMRAAASRAIEVGRALPRGLPYASVMLEASAPAVLLTVLSTFVDPISALSAPPVMAFGAFIVVSALRLEPRLSVFAGVVAAVSYGALVVALGGGAGAQGVLGQPVAYASRCVILMMTGVATAAVAHQLRGSIVESVESWEDRQRVVNIFGRYLTDDVVDVLLHSPDGLRFGGDKRAMTLMMTDLRGFSTFSEHLPAERVMALLNHYLAAMTDVIVEEGGTIDEFIGDAILVLFGAPIAQDDHAARAVRCAVRMQLAMGAVNEWNVQQGLPTLEMGVGVHTGEMVVGNIGGEQRSKYGVVGSAVNLTARIESYTVGGQVLVSESTAAEVAELRGRGELMVQPKGATGPVRLIDVGGIGSLDLPDEADALESLAEPLRVLLRVLEGKDGSAEAQPAEVVALSAHEALIHTAVVLRPYDNVVIGVGGGDAFAKVMSVDDGVRLRFTARDALAGKALSAALA